MKKQLPAWLIAGGSAEDIKMLGMKVKNLMKANRPLEAEKTLDKMLALLSKSGHGGGRADLLKKSRPQVYKELQLAGDRPNNGVYDPSIEYGPYGVGWMSYSMVTAGNSVDTHIAKSTNRGKSWTFVADVNTTVPGTVQTVDGKKLKGAWWNEVSTLVHDPGDKGKEWKLYWHKYFTRIPHKNAEDRVLSHSWIAYRHAPSPSGPWSKEMALFGAGPFPSAPFTARINVADLHPKLKPYIVLTEPGSLWKDNTLYLSFQAVRVPRKGRHTHDIILLSSQDHGKTWKYVNILLHAKDARGFGGDIFTGSSLVLEKGRTFLFVCPEQLGNAQNGHRGTVIFEFADLAKGKLKRDIKGSAMVVKHLKPELAMGGQSDYDERNTWGGIVMPQFDLVNLPRPWRLFNTRQGIISSGTP